MKKQILWLLLIIVVSACNNDKKGSYSTDLIKNEATADGKGDPKNSPVLKFDVTEHNFGNVIQGEKLTFTFKFVNIGKSDLLISQATGSCGCTVAEFPQEPINPGKDGIISVSLNTEGKKGPLDKTITIYANSFPSETVLHVKAMVELP